MEKQDRIDFIVLWLGLGLRYTCTPISLQSFELYRNHLAFPKLRRAYRHIRHSSSRKSKAAGQQRTAAPVLRVPEPGP